MAAAVFAVAAAVGAHKWHKPTFIGLDEQAHFDYAVYLSHGQVPRWGDLYKPETVHLLDCLGVVRTTPRPCTGNTDPAAYPPEGFSYEAQQPPLAYLAYVPFVGPGNSPAATLDHARAGGLAWLAVGLCLLGVVAWLGDFTLLQLAALLTICGLNPWTIESAAVVTNDSAAIAAGAATIATIQLARRRSYLLILCLVVGVVIGLLKATFIAAPVAVLIGALVLESRRPDRFRLPGLWRRRRNELVLTAGAVLSTVGFLLVQQVRAVTSPSVVLHALLGGQVTARPRWSTLEVSVQDAFWAFVPSPGQPLYVIWDLVLYGALAGLLLNRSTDRAWGLRSLLAGVLIASILLGLGFTLQDYFEGHYNYVTPARYFLPMVPLVAYLAVRAFRSGAVLVTGLALPAAAVTALAFGHPY
jgi:hypothetical protein